MKTKFIKRKSQNGDEYILIKRGGGSKRSFKKDLKKILGLANITKEDLNDMIVILKKGDHVEIIMSIVKIVNKSGIYFKYHRSELKNWY